jgi:hypothetical protein
MRPSFPPGTVTRLRGDARRIGVAAGCTAVVNVLFLLVALLWIGPAALVDRTVLTELARRNPTPILVQDGLKFVSAALSVVMLHGFYRWLQPVAPRAVSVGTLFGGLSVSCLLANAVLSLVATLGRGAPAVAQGAAQVELVIGLLALGAIACNGIWYLLVHWIARRQNSLPRGLTTLGLVIGGLSLLPPLGLVVLALTIGWSIWLNRVMMLGDFDHRSG